MKIEDRIQKLEDTIALLQERNQRVESDKAWEVSWQRKLLLTVITYLMTALVFYIIGIGNPCLNALIPTTGYFISTLTIKVVKNCWVKKLSK